MTHWKRERRRSFTRWARDLHAAHSTTAALKQALGGNR